MPRIPVFAANWKMHKTVLETVAWIREFAALSKQLKASDVEVIIAPPFTAIAAGACARANASSSSLARASWASPWLG